MNFYRRNYITTNNYFFEKKFLLKAQNLALTIHISFFSFFFIFTTHARHKAGENKFFSSQFIQTNSLDTHEFLLHFFFFFTLALFKHSTFNDGTEEQWEKRRRVKKSSAPSVSSLTLHFIPLRSPSIQNSSSYY